MQRKLNDLLGARILFALLIFLGTLLPETLTAQNPCPEGPREEPRAERPGDTRKGWEHFKMKKKDFLIRKSGMTPEEAARFFSYYDMQEKSMHEIHRKINKACRRIKEETLSERDCEAIVAEVEKLKAQAAALEAERMKQWGELISASKILKILNAEREFGKEMLRDYKPQRRPGPPHRPPHRP